MKLFDDQWEEEKLWEVRESGLGATAHVPAMHEAYPGWEDAAVPPDQLGAYLRDFRCCSKVRLSGSPCTVISDRAVSTAELPST